MTKFKLPGGFSITGRVLGGGIWSSSVGREERLSAAGLQQSSCLFCCHCTLSQTHLPLRESPEKTGTDHVHLCFPLMLEGGGGWGVTFSRVCCPCPLLAWSFWIIIYSKDTMVEHTPLHLDSLPLTPAL